MRRSISFCFLWIAKFDAVGNHLWSKRFGDTGTQSGVAAAVDAQGQVILAGWFRNTIDFGGGPVSVSATSKSYVAKLDAAGSHVWSRALGGPDNQGATGVAVDLQGNVFVAGISGGSAADLGGGPRQAPPAPLVCFLGKLSETGNHLWSTAYGCAQNPYAPAWGPHVAADPFGAAVVTGMFVGMTDFGQGPVASLDSDAFVFKVDADGAPVWTRTFGSRGYDWGHDVASDPSGNVVVTGDVEDDTDFGSGLLPGHGRADAYLVKLPP